MKVTRHASSNSVGTTGFTDPGNAYASDNSYATAAPGTNSTISSYFGGFDLASYIPAGSQVHSVIFGIERKMSTTASSASTTARVYDNTTAIGNEATSTAEPTTDTVWEYTPTTRPTIEQVRSANFRVLVGAKRGSGATGYTFSLDDVYVVVDYTPPPSAPVVQVKRAIVNGAADASLSFDTLPTVGNTIVVVAATYAGNLASGSVTDNQSHTYTQRGKIEADSGTDNGDLSQYHTTVVNSSGTFTVTINPDGSSVDMTWLIMEISGRAASPYDTAVTAQAATTSTTASTGNITPSEANCLLVAALSHTSTDTPLTETMSGCTLIDEIEGGSSYMPLSVIVKLQTTATTEAATWTIGSSVEWICDVVSYKAAASGGTTYEQTASGTLTSAGEVVKAGRKAVSGELTSSGAVRTAARKLLSGTLTSAGVVRTAARKLLSGTLTSAGEVVKAGRKAVAGTLTSAGSLVKSARKVLSGALTSAGEVIGNKVSGAMTYYQSVAGTLTSSGTVRTAARKLLSGTLTSAGVMAKAGRKAVAGTLTSAGTVAKQINKSLAGTLSSAGTVVKQIRKFLGGVLTSAGGLFGRKLIPIATPLERTLVIAADARTYIIDKENRSVVVAADRRILAVGEESRLLVIAADRRTYMVEKD